MKRSRLRIGCLVLMLVLVLSIIIVAGLGYFLIKDSVTGLREIKESTHMLKGKFGNVSYYCPPAMGVINTDRLVKFISIREELQPILEDLRDPVTAVLADINRDAGEMNFWGTLKFIRRSSRLIPKLAKYFTARNRLLLSTGMGLGEYYYIYVTCYYFYLAKSPQDGPDFGLLSGQDRKSSLYYVMKEFLKGSKGEAESVRDELWEYNNPGSRYRIRDFMLPMMICQLKQLRKVASDADGFGMLQALEKEVQAMRARRGFWPWTKGLPRIVASGIRPYTERLLHCYSDLLNPLEFGLNKYL